MIGLVAAVHLETGDLRFFGWDRGDTPGPHVTRFMFGKDALVAGHFAIIGYIDARQMPENLEQLRALDSKWVDEMIELHHKYFLAQNAEMFGTWLSAEEAGLVEGAKADEIRVVMRKWREIVAGKGA